MGNYSQYKGRSAGRILHCLEVYVGTSSLKVDEITISLSGHCVFYRGESLASFQWIDNTDIPQFKFLPIKFYGPEFVAGLTINQYVKQPFIDDKGKTLLGVTYAVQEIRKILTIDDALFLIWLRDVHNSDWSKSANIEIIKSIEEKVKTCLIPSYHGEPDQIAIDNWKHFAMCAVVSLSKPM